MDPISAFSIAASAASLADLGIKLSKNLHAYYEKIKHLQKDIRGFSRDIDVAAHILTQVAQAMEEEKQEPVCNLSFYQSVKTCLSDGQQAFDEVNLALHDVVLINPDSPDSVELRGSKLLWPLQSSRIETLSILLDRIGKQLMVFVQLMALERHRRSTAELLEDEKSKLLLANLEKKVAEAREKACADKVARIEQRNAAVISSGRRVRSPRLIMGRRVETGIASPRRLSRKVTIQDEPEYEPRQYVTSNNGVRSGGISNRLLEFNLVEEPISNEKSEQTQANGIDSRDGQLTNGILETEEAPAPGNPGNEPEITQALPTPSRRQTVETIEETIVRQTDTKPTTKDSVFSFIPRLNRKQRTLSAQSDKTFSIRGRGTNLSNYSAQEPQSREERSYYRGDDRSSNEYGSSQSSNSTIWPAFELDVMNDRVLRPQDIDSLRHGGTVRQLWRLSSDHTDSRGQSTWATILAELYPITKGASGSSSARSIDPGNRRINAKSDDLTSDQREAITTLHSRKLANLSLELLPRSRDVFNTCSWEVERISSSPRWARGRAIENIYIVLSIKKHKSPRLNMVDQPGTVTENIPSTIVNEPRRPQPEDFGIPGMLHKPKLWRRIIGQNGVCSRCVALYKRNHFSRMSKAIICERCQQQYGDGYRAFAKAQSKWLQEIIVRGGRAWPTEGDLLNPSAAEEEPDMRGLAANGLSYVNDEDRKESYDLNRVRNRTRPQWIEVDSPTLMYRKQEQKPSRAASWQNKDDAIVDDMLDEYTISGSRDTSLVIRERADRR